MLEAANLLKRIGVVIHPRADDGLPDGLFDSQGLRMSVAFAAAYDLLGLRATAVPPWRRTGLIPRDCWPDSILNSGGANNSRHRRNTSPETALSFKAALDAASFWGSRGQAGCERQRSQRRINPVFPPSELALPNSMQGNE